MSLSSHGSSLSACVDSLIFLLFVGLDWFGAIIREVPILPTIVAHLVGVVLISPGTEFVLLGIIVVPFLV